MFFRRSRFLYLLARELAVKYRSALLFGFILGLSGSVALLRLAPVVQRRFFTPAEHIGIVGDYTPTTLPLAIQTLISSGLTALSEDGTPKPELASSWEATEGGKLYTFYLRNDARWQSGKVVEATDVNYNIRDVAFSAVDKQKLQVRLRETYSPFATLVAKPIFKAGLVGFGPYRVDGIRLKGDTVQYLKLVPAQGAKDPVKEFRFFLTETQATTAYKRGDADILPDFSTPGELAQWGKTTVIGKTHYDRIVGLFFNMKNPLLEERSFRQGLSYAIPELDEEAAFSPFPKSSWAQTDTVKKYRFDPEQAKKLLKTAPSATGSAQLTLSTFFPFASIADMIAKSWNSLGIKTKVKVINDISEGFDVLLTSQTLPPDPDQYPLWHSTQKDTNITGYNNAKIDKLLEDGRRETDVEKRKKIYADFARRLTDDTPVRFLYYPRTYTIQRKK